MDNGKEEELSQRLSALSKAMTGMRDRERRGDRKKPEKLILFSSDRLSAVIPSNVQTNGKGQDPGL